MRLCTSPAHLQFKELLSGTVVQTPLVLRLSGRAWTHCDPQPSRYLLTCLRGEHSRSKRAFPSPGAEKRTRGRGSARVTPDHRMGRAQCALQA